MDHPDLGSLGKIVRRHAHEVRNHLNVLEIEIAVLGELVTHPEAAARLKRIRTEVTRLEATLKSLVLKVEKPCPVRIAAGDLLQLWKFHLSQFTRPGQSIEWPVAFDSRPLRLDAKVVVCVLSDLTRSAWKRTPGHPIRASIRVDPTNAVVFELRERPADASKPDELFEEMTRLIEGNGGTLSYGQDPATREWVTALTFAEPVE